MKESKREKGRVLEDLVWSVLKDMGLPFDPTFMDGHTNKKGKKYPDFISNFYNIEVKNWSCKRLHYFVDEFRYYSQIDNRFDPNKGKILIISDPMWSGYARTLADFNGVNIISLGVDDIESNYTKIYWDLREKLTDLFISEESYLDNLLSFVGEIVCSSLRKLFSSEINELDSDLRQAYDLGITYT